MKSLFEQMGGTYREENGYLIPNLTLPEEEQVESDDQMEWIARMNNIRQRAMEIVNNELIYS